MLLSLIHWFIARNSVELARYLSWRIETLAQELQGDLMALELGESYILDVAYFGHIPWYKYVFIQ